jgi:hypothetical protein
MVVSSLILSILQTGTNCTSEKLQGQQRGAALTLENAIFGQANII